MKYCKNFYSIKSNQEIFLKLLEEQKTIGYYSLPYQDISRIDQYTKTIKKNNILVIGTGGSSLGARAIYDFLLPSKQLKKKLFFLETIDPLQINHLIKEIDLNDCHFVIISKSGNTIETICITKYLSGLLPINSTNATVVTEENSKLDKFANDNKLKVFHFDKSIGGRFSVFSVVGLVPLSMVGIDISNLLNGCKRVHESFFNQKGFYEQIMDKARFLVENKNRFNINVVFSYSSSLESFNKWYVQLWAESLGKKNVNNTRQAITPIGLIGPVDQHSFLQLIIDGVRDKTITFVKIANLNNQSCVPKRKPIFDSLDMNYVDGMRLDKMLSLQADSTIKSIEQESDIPCDVITISNVDEYNIAKLMYLNQLMVSVIGAFLQINSYDQPGVELGKKILKQKIISQKA